MNLSSGINSGYTVPSMWYARWLTLFTVLSLLALIVIRFLMVFSFDPEFNGIDNNFVYPVTRMLAGHSIYPDPQQFPFVVNPYAPLLFYVSYFFCKVFGITAGDTIQIYYTVRISCLIADLTTLFFLYKIMTRHFNLQRTIALFAATAFFYLISYWSYTAMRSDSFLLMWYGIIVYLLFQYISRPSQLYLIGIVLGCTAALISKQTAIYFPFMIAVILLLLKHYKNALLILLYWILLCGLVIWLLSKSYPDGNLFNHLVKALNNRLDPHWFYLNIFKRLAQEFTVIPFCLGCYAAFLYLFRSDDQKVRALSAAAMISVGFALIISFKWGSGVGYLQEGMLTITCLLAYTVSLLSRKTLERGIFPVIVIASVIFLHILIQLYLYHLNDRYENFHIYQAQKKIATMLLQEIGTKDEYVYADDVNGTFFKNFLYEKLVLPNKDAVDCCTLPDGNFNYSLLRDGFKSGKIKFLVFHQQFSPTQFHDISFDHYKKWRNEEGFDIYIFRD
ncbi:MAG TPA: glycosyltransferase family 39 protein [Flavitalea sp.]|nr:glycosyltransferase family 39 protein [Flavitalea sp.]